MRHVGFVSKYAELDDMCGSLWVYIRRGVCRNTWGGMAWEKVCWCR